MSLNISVILPVLITNGPFSFMVPDTAFAAVLLLNISILSFKFYLSKLIFFLWIFVLLTF